MAVSCGTGHPDAEVWAVGARIVFQPIVDLGAWAIVGFEALTRFDDGTSPVRRLTMAEAAGARIPLEMHLVSLAVEAAAHIPADMCVTLNVSGMTILLPELACAMARVDRSWGLELYEGATEADFAEIRERATALRTKLFLDDAGALCADESRIRAARPDVVKIDRGLFQCAPDDRTAHGRLTALMATAREVDARVLVEGVSDASLLAFARTIGADLAQGFTFGTPVGLENLPVMLARLRRSIRIDTPRL